MRAYLPILLSYLAVTVCAGCAHRGSPGPIVHQRALASMHLAASPAAIELLSSGEAPPRLAVMPLAPCGDGSARVLPEDLAEQVEAQVLEGATLEQALPAELRQQADWSARLDLEGPLAGWAVETGQVAGPPAPHRAIRMVQGARSQTLARASPDAKVELALLPGGWLAVAQVVGPGAMRDVRLLDLAAGARALQVALAEAHLEAGDGSAAAAAARAAIAFGERSCTTSGAPAFVLARALAAEGAADAEVLATLEEAIEVEPTLWRMRARQAPELARLRRTPAFDELVAPRRLR